MFSSRRNTSAAVIENDISKAGYREGGFFLCGCLNGVLPQQIDRRFGVGAIHLTQKKSICLTRVSLALWRGRSLDRERIHIKYPNSGKTGFGVIEIMRFFHGTNRTGPYFEGWYLKHQNQHGQTLALIPAFHIDSAGHRTASLQVISNSESWWLEYPETQFQASQQQLRVQIGPSSFSRQGIVLHIEQDGLSLHGTLRYGPFTTLQSDIMGPFRLFAGMQCSHGVISMGHSLKGALNLNGEPIDFSHGIGYIETDRGRSFPSAYLWTQCVWDGPERGSLMLAAATVPLPVGSFTGCICSVFCGGREHRLATYQGAKIEEWSSSGAVIRQGKYHMEAEVLNARGQALRAPAEGRMERTIHESLCAEVRYRFRHGKDLLFQHTDRHASFEYSSAH